MDSHRFFGHFEGMSERQKYSWSFHPIETDAGRDRNPHSPSLWKKGGCERCHAVVRCVAYFGDRRSSSKRGIGGGTIGAGRRTEPNRVMNLFSLPYPAVWK